MKQFIKTMALLYLTLTVILSVSPSSTGAEEVRETASPESSAFDGKPEAGSSECADTAEEPVREGGEEKMSGECAEIVGQAEEKNMAVLTAVNVNARETVQLTVGKEVYYGTYSTNYFYVDGKPAYCLEPLKATPEPGSYEAETLETGNLRKGLYYAYGGPGYDTYTAEFGYLGSGGGFDEDREYCMSHCILSYLYSGSPDAFTGLTDSETAVLLQQIDQMLSLPDPPQSFYAFVFGSGGAGQTMGGTGKERMGTLELYKESDRPDLTAGNMCYSLAGAVFGVYTPGSRTPLYEITTDENGYGRIETLPIGTYEIAELKNPEGFALDGSRHTVTVGEGNVCRYRCEDQAQYYPAGLILVKKDGETGESRPQGSADLSGAEFEVDYYAGYYESDPAASGAAPERSWILKTDEMGRAALSDESKSEGDEFYTDGAGQNILPLGTLVIRERKAPEGYLRNEEVYIRQITSSGSSVKDTLYQVPEIPEDVIRGDLQIVKFKESQDAEEEQKSPLQGIIFTVTSKTTGEQIRITTDENGYATTEGDSGERGGLVFDTYTVSELNAPEGLEPAEDFEITISEEGSTLYYILENKAVLSPVRLIKKDAVTGQTIPLSGAEFRLLDAEKEPIAMEAHYPSQGLCETYVTDESGSFVLPEKLPVGNYCFQEVNSPYGYLLEEGLLEFTITEGHDWEEPFTVEFTDQPAKGRICIEKTDRETGEPLRGTVFEIRAKEAVAAPDGTVFAEAGETVDTLTTGEDGRACTGELYLGKYEVVETEQTPGYARSTDVYQVELLYKDQVTSVVKEELKISNAPTELVIDKKESGSDKRLAGAEFTVGRKDGSAEEEPKTYVTDEDGRISLSGLLPGEYYVQETKAPDGYLEDVRVFSVTVDETGRIDGKERAVITVENMKKPQTAVLSGDEIRQFGIPVLMAACSAVLAAAALVPRNAVGRKKKEISPEEQSIAECCEQ